MISMKQRIIKYTEWMSMYKLYKVHTEMNVRWREKVCYWTDVVKIIVNNGKGRLFFTSKDIPICWTFLRNVFNSRSDVVIFQSFLFFMIKHIGLYYAQNKFLKPTKSIHWCNDRISWCLNYCNSKKKNHQQCLCILFCCCLILDAFFVNIIVS